MDESWKEQAILWLSGVVYQCDIAQIDIEPLIKKNKKKSSIQMPT